MQRRSLIKKTSMGKQQSLPLEEERVSGVSVLRVQRHDRTATHIESGPDPMAEYEAFKAKLEIDRDRLDAAVMEQAQVFDEIGERHIRACDLRDAAKTRLAIKDSELAVRYRMKLNASREKSTDSIVNDYVLLDPSRGIENDIYTARKKEADLWGILREAFEQRMRMLRELVSLHATGYFNTQSMDAPKNIVRDALAESARAKMDEDRKARRGS